MALFHSVSIPAIFCACQPAARRFVNQCKPPGAALREVNGYCSRERLPVSVNPENPRSPHCSYGNCKVLPQQELTSRQAAQHPCPGLRWHSDSYINPPHKPRRLPSATTTPLLHLTFLVPVPQDPQLGSKGRETTALPPETPTPKQSAGDTLSGEITYSCMHRMWNRKWCSESLGKAQLQHWLPLKGPWPRP